MYYVYRKRNVARKVYCLSRPSVVHTHACRRRPNYGPWLDGQSRRVLTDGYDRNTGGITVIPLIAVAETTSRPQPQTGRTRAFFMFDDHAFLARRSQRSRWQYLFKIKTPRKGNGSVILETRRRAQTLRFGPRRLKIATRQENDARGLTYRVAVTRQWSFWHRVFPVKKNLATDE